MAKQALGKGLGALIRKPGGGDPPPPPDDNSREQVRDVPTQLVVPSPLQPRTRFIEAPLDELVDSIRQHGIIQPLIARPMDGKLELIAGERRWRAAVKLGLATVPVIERQASDRDVLEMALIENLQREDLNPIEEATGYVRLAREFTLKQEEIATRVGKSRASVANAMRLLDLHPDIQSLVALARLSVGHAKAILSLKDHEAQKLAAERILQKSLTVRAAEQLVQHLLRESGPAVPRAGGGRAGVGGDDLTDPHLRHIRQKLIDRFATHVVLNHTPKKGRIELEYYGNDDLGRLLDLLGVSLD
jgi:ParB family chromosome partitioning protein